MSSSESLIFSCASILWINLYSMNETTREKQNRHWKVRGRMWVSFWYRYLKRERERGAVYPETLTDSVLLIHPRACICVRILWVDSLRIPFKRGRKLSFFFCDYSWILVRVSVMLRYCVPILKETLQNCEISHFIWYTSQIFLF